MVKDQTNVGASHSWLTTTTEGGVIISAFKVKSEEGIKEPVLQTLKPTI